MPTSIAIFEDNSPLRESLTVLLSGVEGYIVCGGYENCAGAADVIRQHQPDIVIMDLDMPGVDGIEGLRIIKEQRPETFILMYTVFEDEDRLFQCLCGGANGYILKNSSFVYLLEAIENMLHGGAPLSPVIARKVLQSFRPPHTAYRLSDREKEVLKYLIKGYSYKMIAVHCHISLDTVRGHIRNIYSKLHVNCGREAVSKALRGNIL
ncbi:response regulator [Dinghuibacter silviterrae]|uniref:LuxR family two component transcriptional regulator n=1 Tax=Dinghuibacter silviterrae TaxID=1539049 RepID=A0A4R8DTK8_9BACT|nr:response regulator transcription factor [Dinghuibacter silviterrae]TDX01459.1 LuxR family two component transcriptional regulator [Dinghuibacter silviterrae]